MADRKDINAFVSGTHNLVNDELIPSDAASSSIGWQTKDGHIELMYGREAQGDEGASGKVWAMHTGHTVTGTDVFFRKIEDKVQYLLSGTWTDIITGLSNTDMTFTNYASLAGNFVFCGSPEDGIFKIVTANPGSYTDMYDAAVNHKGYFFIDKARSIMWNTTTDTTGLYGSHIDPQDSDVYTTVSSEALAAVESGTLAFKAGGATRTCFAVEITDTSSGEVFTDNYDGTLTGDSGGTGTINYTTGVFTITGQTGAGTADYQWENSNSNGVTDFTESATRVAGEGFVLRQDAGGDAIKSVVPFDGSYFSFKESSVYQLTLDVADTAPVNELIRTDVGVKSLRSAAGTGLGIMYMDTGNPTKPRLSLLERNPVGDNFLTTHFFPHFRFEDYVYDDVALFPWDKYMLVACRESSDNNNRLLTCDMTEKTVDVAPYGMFCFTKDSSGYLYGGDPLASTSYSLFTGFDDMTAKVTNCWESAGDRLGTASLKKVKNFIFKGKLDPAQSIKVSVATDAGGYQHVGTILGTGAYVDYGSTFAIGTTVIGTSSSGGDDKVNVYSFLMKLKVKLPKLRKRIIKLEALGYGYCSIEQITDFDIWEYEDKLPKKYRSKQNVSLDGETTNEDTPTY